MAGSFQARPAHPLLDDGTGFRYIREAGHGVGKDWKGRASARLGRAGEDECMPLDGGKAYSIYDAMRRMLEPLRRDWEKFTPAEREVIIHELEAFLRGVKPDENAPR